MIFTSFVFFVFLAVALIIYGRLSAKRSRAFFLLIASYAFYSYWDWRFLSLILISTICDYSIGLRLEHEEDHKKRKRLLLLSCLVNLGILGFFKYFNFFADGIQATASLLGFKLDAFHLNVILPIGISFYTFKTLSYTIDVYRRKMPPTHSLLDYAIFVSFFPNIVAGPIDRARSFLPQIALLNKATRRQYQEGFVLIFLGLFKKVLIGDAAGRIVDNIFGQPDLYRSPELLAGLILFSFQIYGDFGGYSNIARGVAKLFGLELTINFEQPYLSRSFSEFWRRWHISLSSWIWDYLFNPLFSAFLRRIERWKWIKEGMEMRISYALAALPTMILCGLWHGGKSTYIIWGALHGVFLMTERLFIYRNKSISKWGRVRDARGLIRFGVKVATTQFFVIFAWLFFRSEDLNQAGYFINRFIHWQNSDLLGRFGLMVLGFGLMLFILDLIEYKTRSELYLLRFHPAVVAGICAAIFIVVCLFMAGATSKPFVYSQF